MTFLLSVLSFKSVATLKISWKLDCGRHVTLGARKHYTLRISTKITWNILLYNTDTDRIISDASITTAVVVRRPQATPPYWYAFGVIKANKSVFVPRVKTSRSRKEA